MSKSQWTESIFASKAAKSGGVVRRKISSVDKFGNAMLLEGIVRGKGYHLIRSDTQYVVFCTQEPVTLIV